jgi:carbamoyltransferase
MTTVLGINNYFEHPAVALVKDDEILFAAEDERFTGIKHGKKYTPFRTYLPVDAMYHALASTGTGLDEVDEIAYSYHRWTHLTSLWGCFTGHRMDSLRDELSAFGSLVNLRAAMRSGYEIPQRYRDVLSPSRLARIPYREWQHHLSHAASAFFCSGFSEALVVVADGAGERATTSVYLGRGSTLTRIGGVDLPHSLGIFYSRVTAHLGFEPFSDEFKVMGLAALGEPTYREQFRRLVELRPDGRFRIDQAALSSLDRLLGPARQAREEITDQHASIARSAQERLEEALEHLVSAGLGATGVHRLCLAGGIFLNCVANGRIARLAQVREVFVQPAAHDAGTALGAAILSSVKRSGESRVAFRTAMLGTEHEDAAIVAACRAAGVDCPRPGAAELVEEVAERLAAGQVGGVFRGRMEFGPRALGHRSVLADPRDPGMRDRLNRIKGRESFRPVAPIVAVEAFDTYFDGEKNPYMLFTTRVRSEARDIIPSAVHADGTARVQTMSHQDDPWLAQVLRAFDARTGVPVLINTSLNVRGKPIVESPADALACLFTTEMDFLVLGDRLIARTPLRQPVPGDARVGSEERREGRGQ